MDEEKLRQMYRADGWGKLAEDAGLDPIHTESQARDAFRFCHARIEELEGARILNRGAIKRKQARIETLEHTLLVMTQTEEDLKAKLAKAKEENRWAWIDGAMDGNGVAEAAHALVAAALREAAGILGEHGGEGWAGKEMSAYASVMGESILALIPGDHAAALDKLLAEARREGMERAAKIVDRLARFEDQKRASVALGARLSAAAIRDKMGDEPVRCAECDCEKGGADCNWIKGDDT